MRILLLALPALIAAQAQNLSGVHLTIVTINGEGLASMVGTNGSLLPVEDWVGLMPDMIRWVADHAGFTYTLVAPTGLGSNCIPTSSGQYASQYNCGQDE